MIQSSDLSVRVMVGSQYTIYMIRRVQGSISKIHSTALNSFFAIRNWPRDIKAEGYGFSDCV